MDVVLRRLKILQECNPFWRPFWGGIRRFTKSPDLRTIAVRMRQAEGKPDSTSEL
jgi:hypothetical protein